MLKKIADNNHVYDFIAIGAGPANLSLAIQAVEGETDFGDRWLILEKSNQVRWHPGMMLPESRLDTHFVKDLISLVNPRSQFSFLNYLCVHSKVEDFLNCGNTSPFRADFDRYIQWVASGLHSHIRTSTAVTSIDLDSTGLYLIKAINPHGEETVYWAKNAVVGVGFKPKAICGLDLSHPCVIHSSEFLNKIEKTSNFDRDGSVLVVGGGQSAAELLNHLYTTTSHTVTGIVSDFGLLTKEGTAFVNESYNGRFIDRFYDMSGSMREWFVGRRRNMNYGVVDSDLLDQIYNNCYYSTNFEDRAIEFLQFSRMTDARTDPSGVTVRIENRETETAYERRFDFVILACGYDVTYPFDLIKNIEIQHDDVSVPRPIVNRDYSVIQTGGTMPRGKVFLNGGVTYSHGPAGDVLSVIAYRARDIVTSIAMQCAQLEAEQTF